MVRVRKRRVGFSSVVSVTLAAFVIGCGGGGGGGASAGPILGGSNGGGSSTGDVSTTGGSGVITSGGSTTGEVTTDSTTGDATTGGSSTGVATTDGGTSGDVTTGGSTTGDATTGGSTTGDATTGSSTTGTTTDTTSGTTGDPTTGSTGSDSTTGSTTTGSTGTDGSTTTGTTGTTGTDGSTTGGTTTGGTTGTDGSSTGGSTTGTAGTTGTTGDATTGTTGSTTGGTTGEIMGALRPNAIYFGHWNDSSQISSVLPDGTGRQDTAGGDDSVVCAVPDPVNIGKTIYAVMENGHCGVYRGATFNTATSQTLAAPVYEYVNALQAASDGSVMLVATKDGISTLYLLRGGSVTRIDSADGAAISRDGTAIAYTKTVGTSSDLYLWSRATGTTRTLASTGDSLYPSFSVDGEWVLFSSNRDGSGDTPWDLYQIPVGGGTVERITNTPTVSEFGASYNSARTMISYLGVSLDPNVGGVYVRSNTGVLRVANDDDVRFATYWTDNLGRSLRVKGARFQRLTKLPRR